MGVSTASNVLLAKARAKYGKRLKQEDYKALMACNTVTQIAAYLKEKTEYKHFLESVDVNTIHRGQLESLIIKKNYFDVDLLSQYDMTSGAEFAHYIIFKNVVRLLMAKLMSLSSNVEFASFMQEDTMSLLSWHSKLDIKKIQNAKTYEELTQALASSEYAQLLLEFDLKDNKDIDFFAIGTNLYKRAYEKAFLAMSNTNSNCKKELQELLGSFIDINNFARILRMKDTYKCPPEFIKNNLFAGGNLTQKSLEAIVNSEDKQQALLEFDKSYIGKQTKNITYKTPSELVDRFRFKKSRHNMFFSTNAPVVLLSYVFLSEIEISNIYHIIEGVRYKVEKPSIEELLIYKD